MSYKLQGMQAADQGTGNMSLLPAGTPGAWELPNAVLALIIHVTTQAVTDRTADSYATANRTYLHTSQQ